MELKNQINKINIVSVALLSLMLILPTLYLDLFGDVVNLGHVISSVIYILPLCFLINCIKSRWMKIGISTILMLTSVIEVMMVKIYGCYIVAGNILSIANTNVHESVGFVEGTASFFLYAIPVILVFAAYIILLFRINNENYIKFNALLFSMTLAISVLFVAYRMLIGWNGEINVWSYMRQNIFSRPPYNVWYQSCMARKLLSRRQYIKDAEKMKFGAEREGQFDRPKKEIYVLVVGESLRYYNLSIAGYHRSTTPLLESLGNLVLCKNYYTAANITYFSVPQILTRATPDNYDLHFKEKSIFEPFKECGFKTFVMTSSNLLEEDGYRHLSSGSDGLIVLKYTEDSKIALTIDSLVTKYDKVFIIAQFAGNHSPYNNFDKERDIYHPNPVSDNVGWDNHQAAVNAYDNTVLQMDYNLYNIIKVIDRPDTQSALIMTSDHGADYNNSLGDHGRNWNPSETEYHVPLFVWFSDKWASNHNEKRNNLLAHKNTAMNSDNVFYSVIDMADISIKRQYANVQWSIFSKDYRTHERKIMLSDGITKISLDK